VAPPVFKSLSAQYDKLAKARLLSKNADFSTGNVTLVHAVEARSGHSVGSRSLAEYSPTVPV